MITKSKIEWFLFDHALGISVMFVILFGIAYCYLHYHRISKNASSYADCKRLCNDENVVSCVVQNANIGGEDKYKLVTVVCEK